jgi:hypothetical protein
VLRPAREAAKLLIYVDSEFLTEAVMNVEILWDMAACRHYVNSRFGGTYHLHLQGRKSAAHETSVQQVARQIHYIPPAAPRLLALLIVDPEDGDDSFLRNVCSHTDYTSVLIYGLDMQDFEECRLLGCDAM